MPYSSSNRQKLLKAVLAQLPHQIPQAGRLDNTGLSSHSSGGGDVQDQGDQGSGRLGFPAVSSGSLSSTWAVGKERPGSLVSPLLRTPILSAHAFNLNDFLTPKAATLGLQAWTYVSGERGEHSQPVRNDACGGMDYSLHLKVKSLLHAYLLISCYIPGVSLVVEGKPGGG